MYTMKQLIQNISESTACLLADRIHQQNIKLKFALQLAR